MDGIWGPRTASAFWRAVRAGDLSPDDPNACEARDEVVAARLGAVAGGIPLHGNRLVLGGRTVEVPFWIIPWHLGDLPHSRRSIRPRSVVLHHDAAASARACYDVLQNRGLSTHFCIDRDGVVFQFLDPMRAQAWHAVGHVSEPDGRTRMRSWNPWSIGIDLSNPVDPNGPQGKLQSDRGVVVQEVQGRPMRGLALHPCQVEVCLELLRALRRCIDVLTTDRRDSLRWYPELAPECPGIWAHAQINRQKVDPFGFPLERLSELEG